MCILVFYPVVIKNLYQSSKIIVAFFMDSCKKSVYNFLSKNNSLNHYKAIFIYSIKRLYKGVRRNILQDPTEKALKKFKSVLSRSGFVCCATSNDVVNTFKSFFNSSHCCAAGGPLTGASYPNITRKRTYE